MADRQKMTGKEIEQRLLALSGWSVANGKLHKEFRFTDFAHAFAFMTGGALIAERMNHHPEWSNIYNKVIVDLTTHDAGGITGFDMEFAARLEQLLTLKSVA